MELLDEAERRKSRRKIDSFFPDEGPFRRELYPKHLEFFTAGATYRERCFLAANRIGKALKHGTRVATPNGWQPIELLQVGDSVMAGDGSVTRVVGVFPQGEVDLWDVSFDGQRTITTCGQHLWRYLPPAARYAQRHSHGKFEPNPRYGKWAVGSTSELAGFKLESARQRPVVPATKPFELPPTVLPLDPYVLGVLLGDGGLSRDSIKLFSADEEIVESVRQFFPLTRYDEISFGVLGAVPVIRQLGLLGSKSETKHIPNDYLLADKASRLALLQGLMDTDGSVYGAGNMEYSTTSRELADGIEWLAASLGMKARCLARQTKAQNGNGLPSWRISIRSPLLCPFRLQRKVSRWRPLRETSDWLVHAVTPSGRGYATCIEVEHESHTFVIEGGIVTHNTEGAGGYEIALHLTGQYPDWWPGRRFTRPISAWAAGKTNETTRDIVQAKLVGSVMGGAPKSVSGTGLIYGDAIGDLNWKQGVQDLLDTVMVEHVSGGWSRLGLKSYQQGRGAFEGTEQDVIWLDEEPPIDIYGECLIRTATTGGMVAITFTPLEGVTETVKSFLPNGMPKGN